MIFHQALGFSLKSDGRVYFDLGKGLTASLPLALSAYAFSLFPFRDRQERQNLIHLDSRTQFSPQLPVGTFYQRLKRNLST